MAESQGNPLPQGGQGGASGAPNGGEGNAAKPFAFESEQDFLARVNTAIGGRLGAFEKKLEGRFGEVQSAFTAFSARFDDIGKALEGLKPAEGGAGAKGGKGGGKGSDDAPPAPPKLEDSPEWKAAQAKLQALEKKAAEAEQRAAAEQAKSRATALRSTLADQLGKAGVPPHLQPIALGHLIQVEGVVRYEGDDSESIVWGKGDDAQPLDAGMKAWLKTEQARHFLPPKNPGGSGGGPGNGAGNGARDNPDDLLTSALTKHARGEIQ